MENHSGNRMPQRDGEDCFARGGGEDFRRQLEGYGLTTANILYRRPDHPWIYGPLHLAGLQVLPNVPAPE